ncbi:hypothetical protein [Hydrogenophaga sp. RWCD_12]|uniref:hypothetical protein n=1 Tax=Hydrogenophaga sp. RWCD_12 TaxID=3391190 RepID=UPI003984B1DC
MKNIRIPRAGRWSGGLLALVSVWALTGCGGSGSDTTSSGAGSNASAGTPVALSTPASTPVTADTSGLTSADTELASDMQKASSGTVAAPPANAEGRLLASNCFQCHGTNGTGGFESIRGGEAKEVMEFLTKPASKEIMAAHAQGYTTAQLQKIIAYLQQ